MSLRNVRIIALKEFRDVLRDRRTLIFMMLLPVVVIPVLLIGLSKFMQQQQQARVERSVTVAADDTTRNALVALGKDWVDRNRGHWTAWQARKVLIELKRSGLLDAKVEAGEVTEEEAEQAELPDPDDRTERGMADARAIERVLQLVDFVDLGAVQGGGTLASGVEVPDDAPDALRDTRLAVAVQEKEIDAAVHLARDALVALQDVEATVPLHVLYDSSITMSDEAADRFRAFARAVDRSALETRVFEAGLPAHFTEPLDLADADVATRSRKIQAIIGGMLPYFLLAFCFMGAFYPALDVTAGEKERFTLETLLLAPTSRFEIAVGKFIVVFVAAIVAAVLTTSSMAITFTQGVLPAEISQTFDLSFEPLAVALTISMVLPVAALYAAALLAVGLFARSFKEAQSYAMPLQFLFVLPSMVSLIPDLETEAYLAWIPFVNISLLIKELLKGNYLWDFYGITMLSTLVLTVAALGVAAWFFRRESVLLRS